MLKMLMKIGLPKMRGVLVMTIASISPSRREVPPAESLRQRAKVLLPKFRLEAVALRPESPPLIFSRLKVNLYQKMGTGGGPRRAQPTRASRRPPGVPWWVVVSTAHLSGTSLAHWVSSGPKKSPKSFVAIGLRLVLIFCEVKNKQKQQLALWHYVNRLVPKNDIKLL